MAASADDRDTRIRLMHGGPFYDAMSAIGLHHRFRRVIGLAVLCWIVPLLIAVASDEALAFLSDWGVWAKFLLAPVLFTLAEHPIGFSVDECVSVLFRTPLIATRSMDDARRAHVDAKASSISRVPEAICLFLASAASTFNFEQFLGGGAPEWAVSQGSLALTGMWCVTVSNTLYWFLLLRLVWKHVVWSRFLAGVAKCRLRLAVTTRTATAVWTSWVSIPQDMHPSRWPSVPSSRPGSAM